MAKNIGFNKDAASLINDINHKTNLLKEMHGKSQAYNTEVMIREKREPVTDEVLSKNANEAIKANISPQIKHNFSVQREFVEKFEAIKGSRNFRDMSSLITETDSIPQLKYIQKHIYIDGKPSAMADFLKVRAEYKVICLENPEYRNSFIQDRTKFYDYVDKTLNEAISNGKITKEKAEKLSKEYKTAGDEEIMASVLLHTDKDLLPNRFNETNSKVLLLKMHLAKRVGM